MYLAQNAILFASFLGGSEFGFQLAQFFLAMIASIQLDFSFDHVLFVINGVISTARPLAAPFSDAYVAR